MSKRKPGARRISTPSNATVEWQDPVPRPLNIDGNDLWFLEQVTRGRWLNVSIPADTRKQIATLAEHITLRGSHRFFGDNPTPEQLEELNTVLRYSYERGFYLALLRYESDLRHVPELAAWHRKRAQGGAKGRESQRKAKAERAATARAMLAQGDDVPTIAAALKCTPSTVYRLLKPANDKPAKRSRRR